MSGVSLRIWRRRFILGAAAVLGLAVVVPAQNSQVTTGSASEPDGLRTTAAVSAASSSAGAVRAKAYVIGPGDVLSISVWNEPDVTGKVPVRPDGMITVPLIGDIQASGNTSDKVQAQITQKLAEYVKQPAVTVMVEEMNSRQFNVLGQVQHPGSFALSRPTRVLDGLAQAGGFAEFAKTKQIYVLRHDAAGNAVKLPFNYKRVTQGKDDQDDVELQAGDTIIVP